MSNTYQLAGDLYLEPFINGVSGGLIGPIDVDACEVKPSSKKVNIPSKRRERYGQSRTTYQIPEPATISIKTTEIPPVMLAAAFMAESVPINQGSGALTAVNITLPAYPKWVDIGKTNIASTGLTVTHESESLTINNGFELNYALGLIRAAKDGAVKDGGAIVLAATYNAVTGTRMRGNIQPEVRARILLDGKSLIDGESMTLDVPMASLSPKGGIDFMSEKPMEVTLEGDCLIIDGESAPFYVDQPKPAA